MAPRLARYAALYQKWSVNSIRFEIQTQTATTRPGGYVVAITNDPSVLIGSGLTALSTANAMDGAITSKMWQSTVIRYHPDGTVYFCSAGDDPRLFSPGKLLLITDGETDASVDITVIMHWDITFYHAIRTPIINQLPQAGITASYLYTGNRAVRYANWDPVSNTSVPPIAGPGSTHLEMALSGVPPMDAVGSNILWYQLPHPVIVNNVEGDVTVAENCYFLSLRIVDGHYEGRVHNLPSDSHVKWGATNAIIMTQNTLLTPVTPAEFEGNAAVSFLALARKLPSVGQQLMISKEFQEHPLPESKMQLQQAQSKLEQLSSALAKLSLQQ